MRTLFAAAACALAVTALAACGGGSSHPSNQTIRGGGFRFLAPYSWHKQEREGSVEVSPKPVSPELVSVSVFPLLHPYKPALFAAVTRELDTDARQLATRLGGTVKQAATVTLAGIKSRQYELGYSKDGKDFHQRITFVLRGKTEFQLLCRWTGDEPAACGQLEKTFRPA
jgi:hypothetical protein